MAIIATPGSATANSYNTVAEVDRYHEQHVAGARWTGVTDDDKKEAAMIQAARMLDAMFDWEGSIASDTQALGFPRYGATDRHGRSIASTVIPVQVKQAHAQLSGELLDEDRSADSEIETQGITSVKAGPVEVAFDSLKTAAKPISDAVRFLIGELGELRGTGAGSVKVVRV